MLDMILGSASFSELTQNLELLNILNKSDLELIQEERELREDGSLRLSSQKVSNGVPDSHEISPILFSLS